MESMNFNENSSEIENSEIIEDERLFEQLYYAQLATPYLEGADNETKEDFKILPYLLKPKIEYTTEFLHVTKTLDVYDLAHTATVIAVNCLPLDLKELPLCKPKNPSFPVNPADAYHSNFLSMIKAQDQVASTLSQSELSYFSSIVPEMLPPYNESTNHEEKLTSTSNVATHERIVQDGLQRIRDLIFHYVMSEWERRNSGTGRSLENNSDDTTRSCHESKKNVSAATVSSTHR